MRASAYAAIVEELVKSSGDHIGYSHNLKLMKNLQNNLKKCSMNL